MGLSPRATDFHSVFLAVFGNLSSASLSAFDIEALASYSSCNGTRYLFVVPTHTIYVKNMSFSESSNHFHVCSTTLAQSMGLLPCATDFPRYIFCEFWRSQLSQFLHSTGGGGGGYSYYRIP